MEMVVILKILLNVIGFVISFGSLQNAFILGVLIGISAMVVSMAIPGKSERPYKTP